MIRGFFLVSFNIRKNCEVCHSFYKNLWPLMSNASDTGFFFWVENEEELHKEFELETDTLFWGFRKVKPVNFAVVLLFNSDVH